MVDEGYAIVAREKPHYHLDEQGMAVKCYHKGMPWIKKAMWFMLGLTVSFPVEHFLYEKVWPFTSITKWLGL